MRLLCFLRIQYSSDISSIPHNPLQLTSDEHPKEQPSPLHIHSKLSFGPPQKPHPS